MWARHTHGPEKGQTKAIRQLGIWRTNCSRESCVEREQMSQMAKKTGIQYCEKMTEGAEEHVQPCEARHARNIGKRARELVAR